MNGRSESGRVLYINAQPGCDLKSEYGHFPEKPACDTKQAYDQAKLEKRRYVRAIGEDVYPMDSPVSDGAITMIGTPTKKYPKISMRAGTRTMKINGTGVLTLDGLTIDMAATRSVMLTCSATELGATPAVNIIESRIFGGLSITTTDYSGYLFSLTGCDFRMVRNVIGIETVDEANILNRVLSNGNILYVGSTLSGFQGVFENNLVAGNFGTIMNLVQSPGANVKVRFNTFVYNSLGVNNTQSPIYCPIGRDNLKWDFTNNIFFGNKLANGSSFDSPAFCKLAGSTVDSKDTITNPDVRKIDPVFENTFELKNDPVNFQCCIDQASVDDGPTPPTVDLAGRSRPQNSKYDVGCFEYRPG